MPKPNAPSAFAALAALKPATAPRFTPAAPESSSPVTAAAALTLNRTAAPLRADRTQKYPKLPFRVSEIDLARIIEMQAYLNQNGRGSNKSAALRTAIRACPLNATFLAAFERYSSDPKDSRWEILNLLPDDSARIIEVKDFLLRKGHEANASGLVRTAMHLTPLDHRFLKIYDELAAKDGRRRRFQK